MKNSQIYYDDKEKTVLINVPLKCKGKFRCKVRHFENDYGQGFAPTTTKIPSNAYVEWQIGYDRVLGDEEKTTMLNDIQFKGANGKTKNPYELSEILYLLCKNALIKKDELDDLIQNIEKTSIYLKDKYAIQIKSLGNLEINKIPFSESVVTLPTFYRNYDFNRVVVEISIQKQQFGTGTQPMLYVDIPVLEFSNSSDIVGNTSTKTPYGILKIDKENKDMIKDIFLLFGMCSSSHHFDVIEILKLIKDNVYDSSLEGAN